MTDLEAVEIVRQALVQEDGSLVAQVNPNAWAKLQFTTGTCVSPNCHGEDHDESEHSIYHNAHFVLQDVVAVEVKQDYGDGRIRVRAHTREGSACEGMAEAVLRRLSEPAMGYTMAAPRPVATPPTAPHQPVADTRSWWARLFGE